MEFRTDLQTTKDISIAPSSRRQHALCSAGERTAFGAGCTLLILRSKSIHFIVLIGLTVWSSTFNWISTFYSDSLFENQYANQYLHLRKKISAAEPKDRGTWQTPAAHDSLRALRNLIMSLLLVRIHFINSFFKQICQSLLF